MDAHDLGELLGIPLSDEQCAAITAPLAPGLIVAGAGSGKTTVMAARVLWLVASGAVLPSQVLGLTFTNKATAELLARIRTALRLLAGPIHKQADDVRVSTYHAFAGQLVSEFGLLLGREPSSTVMSTTRQRQLAFRLATTAEVDHRYAPRQPGQLASDIVTLDALLADRDVTPTAVAAFDHELLAQLATTDQQKTGEVMRSVSQSRLQLLDLVAQFRSIKADENAMDFSDQVRIGAELARRFPDLGELMRQRYRVVLLDEYQDTSVAQRRMLQNLFGGGHPVTAVGDPCQAIYGWRGASPFNMDSFPAHFTNADGSPARQYQLSVNRRSGAAVLTAANEVANPLRVVHPSVTTLVPDPGNGSGEVEAALLETAHEEAEWVAGRLRELDRPWSEIAVLGRSHEALARQAEALRRHEIPFAVHGRMSLLSLPEVQWLIWALRCTADFTSNDAVTAILLGPAFRVGIRDLAILASRAQDLTTDQPVSPELDLTVELMASITAGSDPAEGVSLLAAVLDPGPEPHYPYSSAGRDRLRRFAGWIRNWQHHAAMPLPELIGLIASESGLDVELLLGVDGGAPGHPVGTAGLEALQELARTYDDLEDDRSLRGFLRWLEWSQDVPDGPSAPALGHADGVTLMTVHAAKGLEFPVVVVPGLVSGEFPSRTGRPQWPKRPTAIPPILVDEPAADGVLAFPPDPSLPRDKDLKDFQAAVRQEDLIEETRLAYVALTRAEERVILTGYRWRATAGKPMEPSTFLLAVAGLPECHTSSWADEPPPDAANPTFLRSAVPETSRKAHEHPQYALAAALGRWSEPMPDPAVLDLPTVVEWDADIATVRAAAQAKAQPPCVRLPHDLTVSAVAALTRDRESFARDQLRPVPRRPSAQQNLGLQFHDWVQNLGGQLSLWEDDEADDVGGVQLSTLRSQFLASPFGARTPVAAEHPISLTVAGRTISGRLDAVYEDGDGFQIVDWKTGGYGTADPVQLAIYRLAWAAERGIDPGKVSAVFVYVSQRRYDIYQVLPDLAELSALITEGAAAIASPQSYRW